jgi:hypothetical protein
MPINRLNNISYQQEVIYYNNPTKKNSDKSFPKAIIQETQTQWDKKDTYEKTSEEEIIKKLKEINRKVVQHEMQHQAAAGDLFRGVSYSYTTGPDNKKYAVSGEVKIDMKEIPDDPEATAQKMQKVQRAALAPSDPSPQDYAVAQQAKRIETKARDEARKKKLEEVEGNANNVDSVMQNNSINFTTDNKENNNQITSNFSSFINKIYNAPVTNIFMQGNFVNVVA